jgi:hypothetical protein
MNAFGEFSASSVYKSWKQECEEAQVEFFNPYKLRHSYATALSWEGMDLADVQQLLGHKSAKTTERYAAVAPHKLAQASEMLAKSWARCAPQIFRPTRNWRELDNRCGSRRSRLAPGVACFRMRKRSSSSTVWRTTVRLLIDALRFVSLGLRSRSQLAAENLFLRKQLALYQERRVAPRRADDATRITLVVLSRLTDWRAMLTIVKPDTLTR